MDLAENGTRHAASLAAYLALAVEDSPTARTQMPLASSWIELVVGVTTLVGLAVGLARAVADRRSGRTDTA